MTMISDSCRAPGRTHAGWYHIRIRRYRHAAITTAPLGTGSRCNELPPKTMPSYLAPGMLWASFRYATTELFAGRPPAARCYVTPSYSGGDSDAFVAGSLRRPMCFGTHGETWAQAYGTRWTVHGCVANEPVIVMEESKDGWSIHLSEGAA